MKGMVEFLATLAWCAGAFGDADAQQPASVPATWEFNVLKSALADTYEGVDTPEGRHWLMVWIEVRTAVRTGVNTFLLLPPAVAADRITLTDGESNTYPAVAMDCLAAPHRPPLFVFFSDLKRRGAVPRTFANRGAWATAFLEDAGKKTRTANGLACFNVGPPVDEKPLLFLATSDAHSPRLSFTSAGLIQPGGLPKEVVVLSFLFAVKPNAKGLQLQVGDGVAVPFTTGWAPAAETWYQEIERYEYPDIADSSDVQDGDIVLSPDGNTVAVVIRHEARWGGLAKRYALLAVNHEIRQTTFFDIDHVVFNPDGKQLAYVFADLKDFDNMVGVRRLPHGLSAVLLPDSLRSPTFASNAHEFQTDGKRIAYTYVNVQRIPYFSDAMDSRVYGLAINDRIVLNPAYREISRPVFAPQGDQVAYVRSQKRLSSAWDFVRNPGPRGDLMVDSVAHLTDGTFSYDTRGANTAPGDVGPRRRTAGIVFDATGTIVYPAKWDNKWFLMAGTDKVSDGFDAIGHPVLGPANAVSYAAKLGKEWLVVSGGVRAPDRLEDVGFLEVSPDGASLAFAAKQRGLWYAFVNGKRVSEGARSVREVTFGADGKHFAHFQEAGNAGLLGQNRGKTMMVMLDGKRVSPEFGNYTFVHSLTVSRDGTKVAYLVSDTWFDRSFLYINDRKVGPVVDYKPRADGKLTIALFDARRMLVIRGVVDF